MLSYIAQRNHKTVKKGIIVKIICFYINQIGYKFQVFLLLIATTIFIC